MNRPTLTDSSTPAVHGPLALGPIDPTARMPGVDPGIFLSAFRRWWWLPALTIALCAGAMLVYLLKTPAIYASHGTVAVSSQAVAALNLKTVAPEESRELEQMRSIEQSLLSPTLLLRVIDANNLRAHPSFIPADAATTPGDESMAGMLAKRLQVELRRGTRLIDIVAEDRDPELARQLVSSIVSEYQKWTDEKQSAAAAATREKLSREEETLRARLTAAEQEVQAFREANPSLPLEGQQLSTGSNEAQALQSELTRARAERIRLEAEYETLKSLDPANTEGILRLGKNERMDEVIALSRAINDKDAEFARVKQRYLEKHPVHIAIRNELDQLKASLAATAATVGRALEKSYHVALENEKKLDSELERATRYAVVAEGARGKFDTLRKRVEAESTLYQTVAARLSESELAAARPESVLTWNALPLLPEFPVKPNKKLFMALAGGFGAFIGLLLALAAELRDSTVRDSAAAERATGTVRLASIPAMTAPQVGQPIVLRSSPGSIEAEAFRSLRAALVPPTMDNEVRSVLFTSATASEGKSFCAVNYAASLALQGRRTLLIDADLRRPGLTRDLMGQVSDRPGLQDYLAGRIEPSKACFETGIDNLYVLTSGLPQRDAAELLSGTRFPALLEEAYQWFDRVVIDTPPVLAVSDALAIARYADRTCLVVRESHNDRRSLARAAAALRQNSAKLCGFVWNASTSRPDASADYAPPVPPPVALADHRPDFRNFSLVADA